MASLTPESALTMYSRNRFTCNQTSAHNFRRRNWVSIQSALTDYDLWAIQSSDPCPLRILEGGQNVPKRASDMFSEQKWGKRTALRLARAMKLDRPATSGLEIGLPRVSQDGHVPTSIIWAAITSAPTVQVVTPGRSGTRWLANVLTSVTDAGVLHASNPTLARAGFMQDQGLITEDVAYGAYLQSRQTDIETCLAEGRVFFDLDCKNLPLSVTLARRNPNSKFLVMIREPQSFISSGLARGYYRSKDPWKWGHLMKRDNAQDFARKPRLTLQAQALKIAWFWNRSALYAQEVSEQFPDRVVFANPAELFSDKGIVATAVEAVGVGVDRAALDKYESFSKAVNANPRNSLRAHPDSGVNWTEIVEAATNLLSPATIDLLMPPGVPNGAARRAAS